MDKVRVCFRKYLPALQAVLIMVWLSNLAATQAYFSVYVLIAFLSFFLLFRRTGDLENRHTMLCGVMSVIFSLLILLGNYEIFTQMRDPARVGASTNLMLNLVNTGLSFLGGIAVSHPVLKWIFSVFPLENEKRPAAALERYVPWIFFLSMFALQLVHLLLVEFPGNLTEDSFTQISEMVAGEYSNFNTFWHTMLFQGVLKIGYGIFGDINMAVGCFTALQAAVLCLAFTHCLMTMYHWGAPRWMLAVSWALYGIMPYQLALGITVWKDVLFAAGCLLVLSSALRISKGLGCHRWMEYGIFVFGSLLFLMARTNGWILYLVFFLVFTAFNRSNKRFLAVMGTLALTGWFLLNPALSMLNVSGSDLAEGLSIPIQQVSRVIAEGETLSEEDELLLSKVVDLEEVPVLYTNWISDPMKVELRSKDYPYFQEHLGEYAGLWVRLGMEHPDLYLKAWVDQTKGYWNAGYGYAMYSETVTDNPYGVEKTGGGNIVSALFGLYFGLSRHVIFFEPLHSIGLHVWALWLCFLLGIVNRRGEWILTVPLMALVVGLWFGTPVYCCFRYVYPLFVSMPLLLTVTLYREAK